MLKFFDIKHKNTYIKHWCLYRALYESSYTKIYVDDIIDGIIKYRRDGSDENDWQYEDVDNFGNTFFFVSPFDDNCDDYDKTEKNKSKYDISWHESASSGTDDCAYPSDHEHEWTSNDSINKHVY